MLGCGVLDRGQKVLIEKGNNSEKKGHFELSPLIVRIALWILNTYSKLQVMSLIIAEILKNVKVFACGLQCGCHRRQQQQRQGYSNT